MHRFMKPFLATLTFIVFASVIVILGRNVNQIFHSIGLWVSFLIILKYRVKISDWLLSVSAPSVLVYTLSSLPFMLFEENVNCLPSGCRLIPVTIPFLLVYMLLVFGIMKWIKIKAFWRTLLIVCSVGLLWEVSLGVASVEFRALPPVWFVYISLWTWMSYAYFTAIPLTYSLRKNSI